MLKKEGENKAPKVRKNWVVSGIFRQGFCQPQVEKKVRNTTVTSCIYGIFSRS